MGRLRALLRRKYRGFFWGWPLLLAFVGGEASAEEIPVETKSDSAPEASDGDRWEGLPEIAETTLPSGLRVWRAKIEGASIEVCSSHRVELVSIEERAALGYLVAILERGGYRASGEDYSGLLKSRGLVSRAEVRGDVVMFCTKGPAKELPLALWTVRGRFARQALSERELEGARSFLRLRASETPSPESRALGRLRNIASPSHEADLGLPVAEEAKAKVSIEEVRALHDKVFFSSSSAVTVLGSFGDAVLDRLVGEHLGLPKALVTEPKKPSEPQTNYRYGLVEDVRVQKPTAFFGFRAPEVRREETELGLYVLALELNGKQKKPKFRVESGSGPLLVLSTNAADVKELEERRKELEERVGRDFPIDSGTIGRAVFAKREGIVRELSEQGASALAYRAATGEKPNLGLDAGVEKKFSPEIVARLLKDAFRPSRRSTVELLPLGFSDPFLTTPPKTHVVEEGESPGSLAFRFGTTPEALLESSGADAKLTKGSKITLPKGATKPKSAAPIKYRVKKGDTLLKIAKAHQVSPEELSAHNQLTSPEVSEDQVLFVSRYTSRKDEVLRVPSKPEARAVSTKERSPAEKEATSEVNEKSLALPSVEEIESAEASDEKKPDSSAEQKASAPTGEGESPKGAKAEPKKVEALTVPATRESKKSSPASEGSIHEGETSSSRSSHDKKTIVHVVAPGDQLLKIAKKYGVSVSELCARNRIERDAKLFVGRKIEIPSSGTSTRPKSSAK